MTIDIDEFEEGIQDQIKLVKNADLVNQILPTLSSQSKWSYHRDPDHLALMHDGKTFKFKVPSKIEDTIESELIPHQGELASHGIAQVHRSDPGSIYFTLQEGKENPTFTIKHQQDNKWKVTPKKKKTKQVTLNDAATVKLASELTKKAFSGSSADKWLGGLVDTKIPNAIKGTLNFIHDKPGTSMLGGLAAGAGYDLLKRNLWNTPEENTQESTLQRALRYLVPSLGLGATSASLNSLFPDDNNSPR